MYVIVWEFEIHQEHRELFLDCYSSTGTWARLFRRAPGYIGTELLTCTESPDHYITIDRWREMDSYLHFQQEFGESYRLLDRQLEGCTTSERKIGTFTVADD